MKRILRMEDVLALIPMSRPTIDRWVKESREGLNDFPVPTSRPGRRILFDAQAVEAWIENRNRSSPTVTPPPTKSERKKSKEFTERQARAKVAIARHKNNKKGGTR